MAQRPAAKHDFLVEKNATFSKTVTITDSNSNAVDLTGYTVEMDVRESNDSSTEVLTLTEANSRVDMTNEATGVVALTVSAADTAALTAGQYVYDLRLVSPSGVADFALYGKFTVVETSTR